MSRRWIGAVVVLVLGVLVATSAGPVAVASAKPTLSVLYGMTGDRVHASGLVTEAPSGALAVLETRVGSRVVRRARARVRGGRLRVSWRYPPGIRTATVRVRVLSSGRRPRVIAVGRYRTLRIAGAQRARKVADVKASQVRSAPEPGKPGRVELPRNSPVRVGEVLALGVGKATPDGLLARITAVDRSAGRTVASTVPATLTEVLPAGELDVRLDELAMRSARAAANRPVRCSSGAVLQVSATAGVTTRLDLRVSWSLPFTITARFGASVQARARVGASISGSGRCALGPFALLPRPFTLGHFTFAIGPVPVVLTPKLQLFVSGDTCFRAAASTSASAAVGVSAGVQYDDGFSPFGGLTRSFTFDPPRLSASGRIQGRVTPVVDVLVNGIGGPRIDFNAGLKLAADINANPWWRLTAPLSVGAQLRLDVWRLRLASRRLQVFAAEPLLTQASGPAPGQPPIPDYAEVLDCR